MILLKKFWSFPYDFLPMILQEIIRRLYQQSALYFRRNFPKIYYGTEKAYV